MRPFFFALILATLWLLLPRGWPEDIPPVTEVPQRARVLGYDRTEFGAGWSPADACTVREAVLLSLIDAAVLTPGCTVTGGTVTDPYTGTVLTADDALEIDHVLPLSAAWDLGAHAWPGARREQFANDPLNLLVVAAPVNRAKSDLLPSEWLPPDRGSRCAYAQRLGTVAVAYDLPLPAEDIAVMTRVCRHRVE